MHPKCYKSVIWNGREILEAEARIVIGDVPKKYVYISRWWVERKKISEAELM
jgi:hypothetical protein